MLLCTVSSPILFWAVFAFSDSCLFSALDLFARKLSGGGAAANLLVAGRVLVAAFEVGILKDATSGTASSKAAVIESSPKLCFALRF